MSERYQSEGNRGSRTLDEIKKCIVLPGLEVSDFFFSLSKMTLSSDQRQGSGHRQQRGGFSFRFALS